MTLADDLKPIIEGIRAIPGQLGLRPYRVFVKTGTWTGDRTGEGGEVVAEVELLENGYSPKVRFLDDEAIALGGLDKGSVRIGPITPEHSTGGTDIDDLLGTALVVGETLQLRLSGPDGDALFVVKNKSFDRALHWTIEAQPVGNTVP